MWAGGSVHFLYGCSFLHLQHWPQYLLPSWKYGHFQLSSAFPSGATDSPGHILLHPHASWRPLSPEALWVI